MPEIPEFVFIVAIVLVALLVYGAAYVVSLLARKVSAWTTRLF